MDVCWYEQISNTLYIIELKDWGENLLAEESDPNVSKEQIEQTKKNISHHRIGELFKKSIDSLSMFLSVLLNTKYSLKIQSCSPFTIKADTKIVLLSIINWNSIDVGYIDTINTEYKARIKPYVTLFGIKAFVMTKKQAEKHFSWVQ